MPTSSRATSPAPPAKNPVPFIIADLVLVAAVLVIHFLTPATEKTTLAAYLGVAAAGLFVVVPLGWAMLRPATDVAGAAALNQARHDIADNHRILQDDLRALADTLLKRLASVEKQVNAHAVNPANLPALGEIADQVAALATITAEDGDLPRLRGALEELQAQLDQVADSVRNLESLLRESPAGASAPVPEPDGPLPPSLMAKAFSVGPAVAGSAVARLIGNGAGREKTEAEVTVEADSAVVPSPRPASVPELSEDEIWHSATDMANDEGAVSVPPAARHALFPKTSPRLVDDSQMDFAQALHVAPSGAGEDPAAAPPRLPKNATALVVSAMIGLGNKPFVRGTGPGLDPDLGVPMEYVSPGRWRWISPDPAQPALVTIWKNDIVRADTGDIEIPPGSVVEASPEFAEE